MKTCFVGSSECLDQTIRYSLLSASTEDGAEQYGVLVEYRDEQTAIPDITTSREDAENLLSLLVQGSVTPVSVQDVVDDWLQRD